MNSGFRNDVCIEPVTKIDWIDVVTTVTVSFEYSTRYSIPDKNEDATACILIQSKVDFK